MHIQSVRRATSLTLATSLVTASAFMAPVAAASEFSTNSDRAAKEPLPKS